MCSHLQVGDRGDRIVGGEASIYLDKEDLKQSSHHCDECRSYCFKPRPKGLWAYCDVKGDWFPAKIVPGKCACEKWKGR